MAGGDASDVAESLETRLYRWLFNVFPAYRGTGARVLYIAGDWQEIRVKIPLSWRTRNYVGTMYGGSMYGAVDPLYMMMLLKALGDQFTVWDKAATIEFHDPGEETLYARCRITDAELAAIRALEPGESSDREYTTRLVNSEGEVHATVEKTVYVRPDE